MVIVDTTVWIDYFRGVENTQSLWLDAQAQSKRLGLTDLILSEVLQGIRDDQEFLKVQAELLRFEVFAPGGVALAVRAAENFRKLRGKGFTIRRIADCWIATFCLREGHEVLHRDRDFDPFESELGLQVVKA
jgi:predicted nucleic acid-binding protein